MVEATSLISSLINVHLRCALSPTAASMMLALVVSLLSSFEVISFLHHCLD